MFGTEPGGEPRPIPPAPPWWTPAFHLGFVPTLLWARLGPAPAQSGFASHANLLVPFAVVVASVLFLYGFAGLAKDGLNAFDLVLALLGGGGLVAIVVLSVIDERDVPRTWERFELSVFAFMLTLGAVAALFVIRLDREGMTQSAAATWLAGGVLLGYALGLLLGFWWQLLGVFGRFVAVFAWPMTIGAIVTGIVIASG